MKRQAGILLPLFSLPAPYGIGGLGEGARRFVDFLHAAGQSVWQILPIGPTGMGDSPYQSFSAFAGNPYFIDLDDLEQEGLLTRGELMADLPAAPCYQVDYPWQARRRMELLRLAYRRRAGALSDAFEEENRHWLSDYALFMAIKDANGGAPWWEWEDSLRTRSPHALAQARVELAEEIGFYRFVQEVFFRQWDALRRYAETCGIEMMGDIPIYTALDSADVWANPRLFQLDSSLRPIAVAGCPPDGFSPKGQLWGNPLYRWEAHREEGFAWWIARFAHCARLYHRVRIDHFRGFDAYYAIPYGAADAVGGRWEQGAGAELFAKVKETLPDLRVVAEDLGFITDSVKRLLQTCGFPGMRVLQFAFDTRDEGENSIHLPHLYRENCVAYTGTHDNQTLCGWLSSLPKEERMEVDRYLRASRMSHLPALQGLISLLHQSAASLIVVPLQDYLGLGDAARINTPSTSSGNWFWRAEEEQITDTLGKKIRKMTEQSGRE